MHWEGRSVHLLRKLLPVMLAALLAGCAADRAAVPATLFERVGGLDGIRTLVDVALVEVHGDERIAELFENIDEERLREKLVEQLCQATGGPCVYTGMSMELAHKGLLISNEEFDFFMEDLTVAMTKVGVSDPDQLAIAEILLPMRAEVVGH